MRTTLNLDDDLLDKARFYTGIEERTALIHEGLRALIRIPLSNIIAMMAGRRAIVAYFRSLKSDAVVWEKTGHAALPAPLARLRILA